MRRLLLPLAIVGSSVALALCLVAVGASVRLVLRRRSDAVDVGRRGDMIEQAGVWFGPVALWGGAGAAAVLAALTFVVQLAEGRPSMDEVPSMIAGVFGLAALGLVARLVGGLVLTLPMSTIAAYGERRGWTSSPASYGVVAAAIATPVTWWLWLLGLSALDPTGRFPMAAATVVALPIGVVAAAAGATVRRQVARMPRVTGADAALV